MNIQEYISSGIVESYVLGLASNEEQLEFEQLCSIHAELRQAKEAFEISLERQALENAMPAPLAVKQAVWSNLQLSSSEVTKPASPVVAMQPPADNKVHPLTPIRSFAKLLAAASIILLIGSTLLNFYFYSQYKSTTSRLNELIASNQQVADNNGLLQAKLQQYETSFELMRNPNMSVIAMKGQPVDPKSLTTVYWNKQTADVYLMINSLPQPAAGKQYQLWAIVDGKPVDAGVLDTRVSVGLIKMKNIPQAQAFAITLENEGGAKAPTMPIYVMGQI